MIVFDASVLIAHLDADDAQHARAEGLLARELESEDFAVNPLTLSEILVVPTREDRLDEVMSRLSDLEVQEIPFPNETATALAQLRVSTRLRMPDCCVLLTARQTSATVASFDDRLMEAADRLGLGTVRT
ncbi:PIN domain-containing protein [Geodermatophilus sp. TF02-6]|uniref:type II toxin-antitoxin system VapC family toxin n=1 Tax=Geodermatophilus sp. TF02-6 TaxID=2250575 RepID=UPI001314717B|nr:PIN domain-containing protein [Geodermatophilus sp. TF02-6]